MIKQQCDAINYSSGSQHAHYVATNYQHCYLELNFTDNILETKYKYRHVYHKKIRISFAFGNENEITIYSYFILNQSCPRKYLFGLVSTPKQLHISHFPKLHFGMKTGKIKRLLIWTARRSHNASTVIQQERSKTGAIIGTLTPQFGLNTKINSARNLLHFRAVLPRNVCVLFN